MAIYTGFLYCLALLGIGITGTIAFIVGLMSTLMSLYISYNIVMGIKEHENTSKRNLNASGLYAAWTVFAILSLIVYMLYIIPILNILCIVMGFIAAIVFLVAFYRTKTLYGD